MPYGKNYTMTDSCPLEITNMLSASPGHHETRRRDVQALPSPGSAYNEIKRHRYCVCNVVKFLDIQFFM